MWLTTRTFWKFVSRYISKPTRNVWHFQPQHAWVQVNRLQAKAVIRFSAANSTKIITFARCPRLSCWDPRHSSHIEVLYVCTMYAAQFRVRRWGRLSGDKDEISKRRCRSYTANVPTYTISRPKRTMSAQPRSLLFRTGTLHILLFGLGRYMVLPSHSKIVGSSYTALILISQWG